MVQRLLILSSERLKEFLDEDKEKAQMEEEKTLFYVNMTSKLSEVSTLNPKHFTVLLL